jgi:hypothetical protein
VKVVIEGDRLPIAHAVARPAFFSIRSFMFVIFFVAGIAIHGSVFKRGGQMALLAFRLGVLANQWKP